MSKTKRLITENNEKRRQLSKINKDYYNDMLLYIRLQLFISERESEEILMELLDHLLEGQSEGKTAYQIFGNDPQGYADEIIEQLPKEKKGSFSLFILEMVGTLISWFLIARGFFYIIGSRFKTIDPTVYLFELFIYSLLILIIVAFGISFIFKLIKNTLFIDPRFAKEISTSNNIKSAVFGGSAFLVIVIISKLNLSIGPSFELTGYLSLIIGAILWLLIFIVKKLTGKLQYD